MGYFSGREMMENLLCLRQQVKDVKMGEGKGLKMNVKVFFGRKNVVVGELDQAFEVLAAAFGIELKSVLMHKMSLMLMFVGKAMHTRFCRIDKTAAQMVVFGAIVELHVPTHRDEEHHKGHHQRTNLQDSFFHAAKVQKIHASSAKRFKAFSSRRCTVHSSMGTAPILR